MQHQSITMAYNFSRLSMVGIFPKAANQSKKAAIKEIFIC
jgi:hypothetical protein